MTAPRYVPSAMDEAHLREIRESVSSFIADCGRRFDAPGKLLMRPEVLDATAASYDENARLRPLKPVTVAKGPFHTEIELGPWGIALWSFEPTR